MNTEQRSIPTKQITMRTLALTTVVATVLIGGLPGTAYCGEYLGKYLHNGGAWWDLDKAAESLIGGPFGGDFQAYTFPNGETLVRECWGSNCGPYPDQCHCFLTFWDEHGNVEYQEDRWNGKVGVTTYDNQGKSTTVIGDPSNGSKEVIVKDFDGVVISDTTYTYDHLGNLKTEIFKDKCGNILNQITCTYTYDDRGAVTRSCIGATQAFSPRSAPVTGGRAGVVGTNAAVVRHPGQSIKGLKRAQGGAAPTGTGGTAVGAAGPRRTTSSGDSGFATGGTAGVAGPSATPSGGGNSASGGTAGVAGPATGTATGGTAGVAGSSATPSGGGNSATGSTAGVAATPTDASQREPKKSPTPAVTATPAGKHLRKRLTVPITAGSATPAPTPSGHGGGGHGGTAGVAGSAAVTGSGGSGNIRQKSQSKRSVSASSNANIQGSGQPVGSVHPTPTPSPRKKKDSYLTHKADDG
jgi:hypothetical protein